MARIAIIFWALFNLHLFYFVFNPLSAHTHIIVHCELYLTRIGLVFVWIMVSRFISVSTLYKRYAIWPFLHRLHIRIYWWCKIINLHCPIYATDNNHNYLVPNYWNTYIHIYIYFCYEYICIQFDECNEIWWFFFFANNTNK